MQALCQSKKSPIHPSQKPHHAPRVAIEPQKNESTGITCGPRSAILGAPGGAGAARETRTKAACKDTTTAARARNRTDAHVEAAREFSVSFACLAGGCRRASQPCNAFGAVFLVVSVGQQPDPGVDMTADDVAEWKKRDPSCVYVHTRTRDKLVRGGTR